MLRAEVWKELRQLDELVQNITVTLPTGETFTYKEECAKWEGQCFVNDILNLDKIIDEVRNPRTTFFFSKFLTSILFCCCHFMAQVVYDAISIYHVK